MCWRRISQINPCSLSAQPPAPLRPPRLRYLEVKPWHRALSPAPGKFGGFGLCWAEPWVPGGGFCAPTELPAARGEAWRGGCAPVLCSWGSPPAPSAWQVPCPGRRLSFKAAWKPPRSVLKLITSKSHAPFLELFRIRWQTCRCLTRTRLGTGLGLLTNLGVSEGFQSWFASLLLVVAWLLLSQFWSLKRKVVFFFFLIGTSEYFHTWACFPIALGLTSCKGVLQCSHCCFCFAISLQTGLVWCRAHTSIHRVPLKGFCVWKEGKLLAHFGWNKQRGSWGCGQDWVSCFLCLSASLRCWHPPWERDLLRGPGSYCGSEVAEDCGAKTRAETTMSL